ncbi:hypothetical protein DI09_62p150 [Mitosporidium daphniae]|uniref:Uncharacterized protein n=1 Tax=Mitosporidium daphniae TaxID=1485682 RepID=A0A098VS87_9MICR|nr:uncharacterized protein DI09_62p150 [Mitosporidium daphniae]KGG50611.1 hypothetical protein DI09_62p150 [Mitosporidium daphniae]|eukprot:XP_013237038.1 uncharacterized protein DI09_62p150 [Mitosporidium daphniae]
MKDSVDKSDRRAFVRILVWYFDPDLPYARLKGRLKMTCKISPTLAWAAEFYMEFLHIIVNQFYFVIAHHPIAVGENEPDLTASSHQPRFFS